MKVLSRMQVEKKRFRKMFPYLAEEMETRESGIAINSVRSDIQTGEIASSKRFVEYTPDVIDFIRRCDNEQQAEEIIDYLEKRGEVGRQYAQRLKKQLKEKGVRSFGPKKEEGYYLKKGCS